MGLELTASLLVENPSTCVCAEAEPDELVVSSLELPQPAVQNCSEAVSDTRSGPDTNNNIAVKVPDAREFRHSPVLGNYVIASCPVGAGEIIAVDTPLCISAYGPSSRIPYCLSCYKDIALSLRCSKCRWPICDSICESAPQHAQNECPILAATKARPRMVSTEYTALETLRCLLLRDNEPEKWQLLLQLEAHNEERCKSAEAQDVTRFVMNFIQNRCKLIDRFTEQEISHALGVISVNTFSGYSYIRRNISMLFPASTSFIQHDCNPNILKYVISKNNSMEVAMVNADANDDLEAKSVDPHHDHFAIKLTSTRPIQTGDTLSINYVDIALGVIERRSQLRESFYFYCDCLRCRVELFDELLYF